MANFNKLPNWTERVSAELRDLEKELDDVELLRGKLERTTPDTIEIRAVASTLHSFYTGVERILLTIAKSIDEQLPTGHRWHRDLIDQLSKTTRRRRPLLDDDLRKTLLEYAAFRHFYRHSYGASFEWARIKPLWDDLWSNHAKVAEAVASFITNWLNDDL